MSWAPSAMPMTSRRSPAASVSRRSSGTRTSGVPCGSCSRARAPVPSPPQQQPRRRVAGAHSPNAEILVLTHRWMHWVQTSDIDSLQRPDRGVRRRRRDASGHLGVGVAGVRIRPSRPPERLPSPARRGWRGASLGATRLGVGADAHSAGRGRQPVRRPSGGRVGLRGAAAVPAPAHRGRDRCGHGRVDRTHPRPPGRRER